MIPPISAIMATFNGVWKKSSDSSCWGTPWFDEVDITVVVVVLDNVIGVSVVQESAASTKVTWIVASPVVSPIRLPAVLSKHVTFTS